MKQPKILKWILFISAAVACGCSPVVSGVRIVKADVALDAAKQVDAASMAAYEYVIAEEYLRKARQTNAYSRFWLARQYAAKALEMAQAAYKQALIVKKIEKSKDKHAQASTPEKGR